MNRVCPKQIDFYKGRILRASSGLNYNDSIANGQRRQEERLPEPSIWPSLACFACGGKEQLVYVLQIGFSCSHQMLPHLAALPVVRCVCVCVTEDGLCARVHSDRNFVTWPQRGPVLFLCWKRQSYNSSTQTACRNQHVRENKMVKSVAQKPPFVRSCVEVSFKNHSA